VLTASFSLALFTFFTGTGGTAETPYGEVTIPFEVRRLPQTDVYYTVGQTGVPGPENQGHTSNAGFVVTKKGVVVYDALGTPALSYLLLQHIRRVTQKPVAFVVAGHYHADHVYGLQTFKEHAQATVWAHEAAAEYIGSAVAEDRLEQRRGVLYPWIDEKTHLVKPDRTFRDRTSFDMGDTTIELVYAGPAHAPDDVIMIVKEPGVVFSGDLIFGGRLPFLGGEKVNTKNWLAGLRYLESISPRPRYIVPGHGEVSANAGEAIAFTRGYIEHLRKYMGQAAEELTPFEEAYEQTDWSRYRDAPTFEQANRGNAYQVYLEMQAAGF
jgi:glyoxylase-like metal-dependent hydrolase (beta-lactamase superfamily II)